MTRSPTDDDACSDPSEATISGRVSDGDHRAAPASGTTAGSHAGRNGNRPASAKEKAHIELVERGFAELVDRVGSACADDAGEEAETIRSAVAAMLTWAAENPALARACLADASSAGEAAWGIQLEAEGKLSRLFAPLLGVEPPPANMQAELLMGGLVMVMAGEIRRGRCDQLPDLLDDLVLVMEAAVGHPPEQLP